MSQPCSQTDRLTTLEVKMEEVIGNGRKDGRLDKAEVKIDNHSRLIWIGMGGIYVVQFFIAAKLLKFL